MTEAKRESILSIDPIRRSPRLKNRPVKRIDGASIVREKEKCLTLVGKKEGSIQSAFALNAEEMNLAADMLFDLARGVEHANEAVEAASEKAEKAKVKLSESFKNLLGIMSDKAFSLANKKALRCKKAAQRAEKKRLSSQKVLKKQHVKGTKVRAKVRPMLQAIAARYAKISSNQGTILN